MFSRLYIGTTHSAKQDLRMPFHFCHAHPIGSSRQNSNIFLFAIILCKAKGKNRLRQIFGEIDRF